MTPVEKLYVEKLEKFFGYYKNIDNSQYMIDLECEITELKSRVEKGRKQLMQNNNPMKYEIKAEQLYQLIEKRKEFISFANYFHKWKLKIQQGICPKRPDEIFEEWLESEVSELKSKIELGQTFCKESNIKTGENLSKYSQQAEPIQSPEAKEIKGGKTEFQINIRRILCDYERRSDYSLANAEYDMTELMEEYHDQFQPELPSEEEIERWACDKVNEIDLKEYGYGDCLIEGAKWVINHINKK